MKLKDAKEILQLNVKEAGKKMPPDTLDALKLAIQAITAILDTRKDYRFTRISDIPGETPDTDSP